jgi:hypothetical protein
MPSSFLYYVDRNNNNKGETTERSFFVVKKLFNQLIESYTLYKDLPEFIVDYASLVYIRYNETLELEISSEEKMLEEAYKRTLQGLYKF